MPLMGCDRRAWLLEVPVEEVTLLVSSVTVNQPNLHL